MAQVGYTSPSWRTQLESPRDPLERVQPLAQELGGKINQIYYSFGEYDVVAICEFPDDEAMAAFALAVAAAGATRSFATTKLLDVQQGLNAMRRAESASSKYVPPLKEFART
jgi:uncharacterized protein with GYD domain